MHPLVYGDYPPVMRSRVGARLPVLTAPVSKKVRRSFDFIGFNHYIIMRIRSIDTNSSQQPRDYYVDAAVQNPADNISKVQVETAPWSLSKLLEHLKLNYGNPPVWIHENGYGSAAPGALSKTEYDYDDANRTEFLQDYLEVLQLSTRCSADETHSSSSVLIYILRRCISAGTLLLNLEVCDSRFLKMVLQERVERPGILRVVVPGRV